MDFGDLSVMLPPPPGLGPRDDVKAFVESKTPDAIVREKLEERCYVADPTVTVFRCTCFRCGKVWMTLQQQKPKSCPGCKSNWWDRIRLPRAGKEANGFKEEKVKKKKKRAPLKKRPRKNYATDEVAKTWSVAGPVAAVEEIPADAVEVLGAVGGSAVVPAGDPERPTRFVERILSPAALESLRASIPVMPITKSDPPLGVGQPVDGGGMPEPADIPFDIDDDWHPS